ncbi:UDP-N-acetylmuramate dehydrogenase [Allofustis seminis]|uniref:UDP-N-acetylmuramate dehydrogenase n=1 Tax=Allofustis seminis TaxID=166939 RepID=UPI000373E365|nr:UDP-N-acetylmuramate dehydrogenase [Allofustis seminis]
MHYIREKFPNLRIKKDEHLSQYTYTQTGGPADYVVFPETVAQVKEIINWVNEKQLPLTILGNASNLIVRDGGIRGVVMMLTALDQIAVADNKVVAQAGAALIDASEQACQHHLTGLEFACGIPGSVGGALYMNAGAYGGEVKDCIEKATVITRAGEIKTYTHADLDFSYRHSLVQKTGDIVLEVTFALSPGNVQDIRSKMDELTELRTSKQPLEYPSCGSVFKRPEGHFTGKLIQDAGLQGLQWGGAQISTKHAGFIVNIDHATATDYVKLIAHIQAVIKEKYDVILETEVHIIGEEVSE